MSLIGRIADRYWTGALDPRKITNENELISYLMDELPADYAINAKTEKEKETSAIFMRELPGVC